MYLRICLNILEGALKDPSARVLTVIAGVCEAAYSITQ